MKTVYIVLFSVGGKTNVLPLLLSTLFIPISKGQLIVSVGN